MKNTFKYISEIRLLIGEGSRKLPLIILLFLFSSLLDVAGIGLVVPYVAFIVEPAMFMQGDWYQYLIAIGFPVDSKEILIVISCILLGVFVFKTGVTLLINKIILSFSHEQGVRLSSLLMHSFQNLPYQQYLQRNSSEYIFHIQSLTGQFTQVLLTILRMVSEIIVASAIFILLALSNGVELGLFVLILGGGIYIYDLFFRRNIKKYGQLTNRYSTRMIQGIHEGIEGLKEIRILGKEKYFHHCVEDNAKKCADLRVRTAMISIAPRFLLELLIIVFIVSLVFGSIFFNHNLDMLLPTLSMFAVAAIRLLPSATQVVTGVAYIRFSRNAVGLLYNDLRFIEGISDDEGAQSDIGHQEQFKKLTLKGFSFKYPNTNRHALKNIYLELQSGESIGLIGPSGSGKTTLVDAILGLLEPQEGEILYNDSSIKKNLSLWRSQVAYLPQQVFLIDASLKCNVALGFDELKIDTQKVHEALIKARLTELVDELPEGIDTKLGERGVRLSGGQRQRVALARAFYHDRNILVMDESTSALDQETEREIIDEIERLKGSKTMIVIAHRLSTVQHCDRIYRLEKGVIVKEGSFEQVTNSTNHQFNKNI